MAASEPRTICADHLGVSEVMGSEGSPPYALSDASDFHVPVSHAPGSIAPRIRIAIAFILPMELIMAASEGSGRREQDKDGQLSL